MDISYDNNIFDIISSGCFNNIKDYNNNELYDYLPILYFHSKFCFPSLCKSLYSFSEINNIQEYFLLDSLSLLNYIKQNEKTYPIENILFYSNNNNKNHLFPHTIESFELGSSKEQLRIIILELYQLSNIYNYSISDDKINIPDSILSNIISSEPKSKKQDKKNKNKFEERKRKKLQNLSNEYKFLLKKEAAKRFPILSSYSYISLLKEIIPCIPFILSLDIKDEKHLLSISNIILSLLLLPHLTNDIITIIIKNHPNSLLFIIQILLKNLSLFPSLIKSIIFNLCSLSTICAKDIRRQLTIKQKLPLIALSITSTYLHDEISYLCSILSQSGWMKGCLRKEIDCPVRKYLLQRLSYHQNECLNNDYNNNINHLELISLLRIYCTIMNTFTLDKEAQIILNILANIRLNLEIAKLGLSFILVCESILTLVAKESIENVIHILLKSNQCTEFFLLVAVHFHTKKTSAIVELVRSTLQLHTIFHTDSLNQIGHLITNNIFSEEDVTKRAIELSPIVKLSTHQSSSLTLNCIYHLLTSQLFIRYKVDIGDWIIKQIKQSYSPIHHLLPAILEEFIASILNRLKLGYTHEYRMNCISEDIIQNIISNSNENITPCILIIYYLLYYYKQLVEIKSQEASKNMRVQQTGINTIDSILCELEYSPELIESLPIQKILSHLHLYPNQYENIYPPLLSLIISQFPRYFLSENLLLQEDLNSSYHLQYTQYYYKITSSTINNVFSNENLDITKVTIILSIIRQWNTYKIMKYFRLIMTKLVPIILEKQFEYFRLVKEFQLLWEKVYCENPSEIGLLCINLLQEQKLTNSNNTNNNESSNYLTDANLVNDPLIILRVDSRVFTCPSLFQMLLQILNSYMIASRNYIITQAKMTPQESTKQDELNTLLYAQDSTILQILLEITLVKSTDEYNSTMDEIKTLICGFLHSQFIRNPLLVKLIHFQTYNYKLIPILISGVPSLHLCLKYIPELLLQENRKKQLFAIQLGCELIKQYPLTSSLDLGYLILNHLNSVSCCPDSIDFLKDALPCIKSLCNTFPIMIEKSTQLLLDLKGSNTNNKISTITKYSSCREIHNSYEIQEILDDIFKQIANKI